MSSARSHGRSTWWNVWAASSGASGQQAQGSAPVSKDRQDFAEFYSIYDPLSATMWLDPLVIEHSKGTELIPPGPLGVQPADQLQRQACAPA